MQLYIANKLYSSWSMRPWVLMHALSIPFEEVLLPFDTPEFKTVLAGLPGPNRVPVLADGQTVVWESLAIIEYLAEKFPDHHVWPDSPTARAHARASAAEMHAGFQALRSTCPMNFGKDFATRDRGPGVAADAARITALWREAREHHALTQDGPFLYGAFSAADAMYAPIVARIAGYGIKVDDDARAYITAVRNHPAYLAWRNQGLSENWVVQMDEVDEPAAVNHRPHL
ncbi:MAG TPA: glutathione S-transferase family protein [Hyphomicrobiaceae bacterium]|nr:glutathione S-transferase family protein [Hyphomicrobiaceae bacterium]